MSNHEFPSEPHPIGPYEIVRELGRGGMGIVYEAQHRHLQRRVALKLLRPEFASDPTQVERFVREGRAACNIRHPHVIDVYEFDFERGAPYMVMDFLQGETLQQRLARTGRLELDELLGILLPVLSGVAAAHAAGIVHRDLKPSNIMLARTASQRCVPKVLDFGTAKLLTDGQSPLTLSAALLGTPNYMSPEQLRTARDVDARCDQYALGVILYECSTGQRPFVADGTYALLHAIMTAPVEAPSALVRGLPRAFDAVVLRAMQRDRSARYAGVRELGAALLAFAPPALAQTWSEEFGATEHAAAVAEAPTEAAGRTWVDAELSVARRGSTKRGLVLAAISGVLAASALIGWRAWEGRQPAPPSAASETARHAALASQPASAATTPELAAPELMPDATPVAVTQPASAPPPPSAATPAALQPSAAGAKTVSATRRQRPVRNVEHRPPPSVTLGDNDAPILE